MDGDGWNIRYIAASVVYGALGKILGHYLLPKNYEITPSSTNEISQASNAGVAKDMCTNAHFLKLFTTCGLDEKPHHLPPTPTVTEESYRARMVDALIVHAGPMLIYVSCGFVVKITLLLAIWFRRPAIRASLPAVLCRTVMDNFRCFNWPLAVKVLPAFFLERHFQIGPDGVGFLILYEIAVLIHLSWPALERRTGPSSDNMATFDDRENTENVAVPESGGKQAGCTNNNGSDCTEDLNIDTTNTLDSDKESVVETPVDGAITQPLPEDTNADHDAPSTTFATAEVASRNDQAHYATNSAEEIPSELVASDQTASPLRQRSSESTNQDTAENAVQERTSDNWRRAVIGSAGRESTPMPVDSADDLYESPQEHDAGDFATPRNVHDLLRLNRRTAETAIGADITPVRYEEFYDRPRRNESTGPVFQPNTAENAALRSTNSSADAVHRGARTEPMTNGIYHPILTGTLADTETPFGTVSGDFTSHPTHSNSPPARTNTPVTSRPPSPIFSNIRTRITPSRTARERSTGELPGLRSRRGGLLNVAANIAATQTSRMRQEQQIDHDTDDSYPRTGNAFIGTFGGEIPISDQRTVSLAQMRAQTLGIRDTTQDEEARSRAAAHGDGDPGTPPRSPPPPYAAGAGLPPPAYSPNASPQVPATGLPEPASTTSANATSSTADSGPTATDTNAPPPYEDIGPPPRPCREFFRTGQCLDNGCQLMHMSMGDYLRRFGPRQINRLDAGTSYDSSLRTRASGSEGGAGRLRLNLTGYGSTETRGTEGTENLTSRADSDSQENLASREDQESRGTSGGSEISRGGGNLGNGRNLPNGEDRT